MKLCYRYLHVSCVLVFSSCSVFFFIYLLFASSPTYPNVQYQPCVNDVSDIVYWSVYCKHVKLLSSPVVFVLKQKTNTNRQCFHTKRVLLMRILCFTLKDHCFNDGINYCINMLKRLQLMYCFVSINLTNGVNITYVYIDDMLVHYQISFPNTSWVQRTHEV